MQISVTEESRVPVFILKGRLDHKGAMALESALDALPGRPDHLVMDLGGVEYISSMGIRSLLTWEKEFKKRSGGILLCELTPGVSRVLHIAGLLPLFQVARDRVMALGLLSKGPGPSVGESFSVKNVDYSIVRAPDHLSWLDFWGEPTSGGQPLTPIALDELGIGFGLAGLGSTAEDAATALGAFMTTGEAAAVIPADSQFHPDWMLSRDPSESILFVRRGLSFTGRPACTVDVVSNAPFSIQTVLEDILARLREASAKPIVCAGFVASGHGTDIPGKYYRTVQEIDLNAPAGECRFHDRRIFAAGLVRTGTEPDDPFSRDILSRFPSDAPSRRDNHDGISWTANAIIFEGLVEGEVNAPGDINHLIRLENLGGVCRLDPDSRYASLRLWVYLPESIRSGEENRLLIEMRNCKPLSQAEEIVARRIYRDATRMVLEPLTGGFSAATYRVHSYDSLGRELLPTVLKIGGRDWIQREVSAYHNHVQKFILNNSTTILGTAEHDETAGLRYNFLGITGMGGRLVMLRDAYPGLSTQELESIFTRVFTCILKPWYGQPKWDILLPYVEHDPRRLFKNICNDAESTLGISPDQERIICPALERDLPNPYHFLKHGYPGRAGQSMRWYTSIIHGDLNLANILLDDNDNLYVIDFSETRQGNIVSDLARLEVIVSIGLSRMENEADASRVVRFVNALARNETIAHTPEHDCSQDDPLLGKAFALVRLFRDLAGRMTIFEDDPVPYYLAMLQWILPMVSYRDITILRKRASAWCAGILAERILQRENQSCTGEQIGTRR